MPTRPFDVLLYGSYGYTGRLIADRLKATGLRVLLAGRDQGRLSEQSGMTGFPFRKFAVTDRTDDASLLSLLSESRLLLNCAGPFSKTAAIMAKGCIQAGTHYLDITGEYRVFEHLMTFDQEARNKGVIVMPGVGFDVVPTDCMALHLHEALPDATRLVLAFASRPAGVSSGTARTALQHAGEPSLVRRDGKLVPAAATAIRKIDFGPFQSHGVGISWGDIATAYRTTGIPDIEVYLGVSAAQAERMTRMVRWGGLLRLGWVRWLADKWIGRSKGPSRQVLDTGRTFLYGAVENGRMKKEALLEAPNGYRLTAISAVEASVRILMSENPPGYHTPAGLFGSSFVTSLEGVSAYVDR